MTQTDKYGNASTPRTDPMKSVSSSASSSPVCSQGIENKGTDETESDDNNDPSRSGQPDAYDSLLESLRMMCCCLLPDTNEMKIGTNNNNNRSVNTNNTSSNYEKDNTANANNNHSSVRKLQIIKQRRYGGQGSIYGHVDGSSTFHETSQIKLLPPIISQDKGKKCLVLDLDETLVHSSFRAVPGADFVIPVQIEDVVHYVYVAKRPGVDEFLIEMAKHYEVILYTASLNKYADPLLDLLDPHRTIRTRLFRESCVFYEGNYVKDLSILDRDLSQTIIVDNSPSSYIFHPENAIDCSSFIDDPEDVELKQIASFLTGVKDVKDVRSTCSMWREWPHVPRLDYMDTHSSSAPLVDNKYESREDKHVQ
jgi:RNA polymerase II subunit A small phosphatase-like protein